ncbi:hypothetical protein [Desulfatitalea tepidiphila]|uniref:hypothetical protein n=1 Tax=Desulfatitalea tepidiphila TaxID=1185843 RepID=UPI0006B5928F|nr:hypothetical protein [Desulfatitalea tepidiphila]
MKTEQPSWTTGIEINFLKGLGSHGKPDRPTRLPRAELLARYIAAAETRERWDGIDRDQVIGFAQECLRHEIAN